jgi:hypothetical protein
MLMAIVGMIDDEIIDTCIRGNGKTNVLTYYLYRYHLQGKEIWTNYYTTFSDEIIGFQEMINKLKEMKRNEEKINVILGVTEMQELISSIGSTKTQELFISSFANQIRKLNTDCLYDTQIFKNINIKLRRHTENVRIPIKLHRDFKPCNFDRCEELHLIEIHSYIPFKREALRVIKAYEVGKLYNSMDVVIDTLEIPKEEKTQATVKKNIAEPVIIDTIDNFDIDLSGMF